MQTHEIRREHAHKKPKLVARGGKRGKTAGKGGKGQTARAGHRVRPAMRDIIKKLPKLRGYSFKSIVVKPLPISITIIEKAFDGGVEVNREALIQAKIVSIYKGNIPSVKIVGGQGEVKIGKKLVISGIPVSASVRAAIEKAGGEVK